MNGNADVVGGAADGGPPRSKRLRYGNEPIGRKIYVILENASLECARVGKNYELLSTDKHGMFLRQHKKDPTDYRPDITHQCLLMLLDSPLNRAGHLKVFIHTQRNVLIDVNPQCRIPRTYDRFAGLMVQLLHKLKVRAEGTSEMLLKVIKNPISQHLPVGCRKIGTSFNTDALVPFRELVPQRSGEDQDDEHVAVVIGAMAKGKVDADYVEKEYKLSSYPLSAALTCAKLCTAFEEAWDVL